MDSGKFTRDDYILRSDTPTAQYKRKSNRNNVHWGQRKLLVGEVQFIIYFVDLDIKDPINIVYAGAAPGTHINILLEMFPFDNLLFHLYDKGDYNAFNIKESERVKIHDKYFDNSDAEIWSRENNVYFISDIRAVNYRDMSKEDNEIGIWNENLQQRKWIEIMKPKRAQLKFRLPYPDIWEKIKGSIFRELEYLDGIIFFQGWSPQTSTETRLVPYPELENKTYDIVKYEQQLAYFNQNREIFKYEQSIDPPELIDDYDSNCEVSVIRDYLYKMGKEGLDDQIRQISRYWTNYLGKEHTLNMRRTHRVLK
jgi:hypothetical protein